MKTNLVKAICCLMLLALLSAISFAAVHAQGDLPVWVENLVCDPVAQKYQGVVYCTGVISSSKGQSYTAHVIVVDLNSSGVQIEYALPEGINGQGVTSECKDVNRSTKYLDPPRGPGCNDPDNQDWYPVMTLEKAVRSLNNPNLAVVINGDYSACTTIGCKGYRDHGPEGLTVVKGNRLDGPKMGDRDNNIVNRPWLAIGQNTPLRAELHQYRSDDGSLPYDWIYTGIGGAPWLIQNGEITESAIRSCDGAPGSCYDSASQTAVGLTRDKRWLFFVLGVKPEKLLYLARFMNEKLDVWQAIKFDGGGSSQLYYAGASEPFIERGDRRLLTNYLAIIALPGRGIFPPEGTPKLPPVTKPGWWERLWKSISERLQKLADEISRRFNEWWQKQQRELEKKINQWWEDTQRKLTNWLEQQLVQWINELCETALLPGGAATSVWYLHRRKNMRNKM